MALEDPEQVLSQFPSNSVYRVVSPISVSLPIKLSIISRNKSALLIAGDPLVWVC